MKKVVLMLVVISCLLVTQLSQAKNLIPSISITGTKVSLWGFSQVSFDNTAAPKVQVNKGRLYAKIEAEGLPLLVFMQTQPIAGHRLSPNFIQQLYVQYGALKIGRLYLAGSQSNEAPYLLRTIKYSRTTVTYYALGIQVGKDLFGCSLLADVTGDSNAVFYSKSNFRQVEFSGKISRRLYGIETTATTKLSQSFRRLTLDAERNIGGVTYKGATYVADAEVENVVAGSSGGYFLIAFNPFSWMELHSQVDYRKDVINGHSERSTIWTNGIRVWEMLTVDYESKTHRPVVRFQIRY